MKPYARPVCLLVFTGFLLAQEAKVERQPGGFEPCLSSCCIGPRVGLEMNEGVDIHRSEWIAFGGQLVSSALGSSTTYDVDPTTGEIQLTANPLEPVGSAIATGTRAYMAYDRGGKANGFYGFLASYFIGPRVGAELHERKIRSKEWLLLIPCVNLYPAIAIPLEAYEGKTMSEIEVAEGLRK